MPTLSIAKDFSGYPGPRYRKNGEFSGEVFREEKLIPALRAAIDNNDVLTVILDDVAGYGSSFLEESFGGLVRAGFAGSVLHKHLQIEARTDRFKHHRLRAQTYILDAIERAAK